MQSYTLYTASEFLRDRHPYIPDPNPRPVMDPEQVALAYNERAVPKLADLLIYDQLTSEKRRDALHTLNEIVSNQEQKELMIENKIVISATALMTDENKDVRFEAACLVGSLVFLVFVRIQFDSLEGNYTLMQSLIFDQELKVRESVGWLLYRLSMHKTGTEMLNKSNTIAKIVDAFNLYASASKVEENIYYDLYLLEAMINLSRYDVNIKHMLKKGLLGTFNTILLNDEEAYSKVLSKGLYKQLRELVLSTCKNVTLIDEGKIEAYAEHLVMTGANFLNSELEMERLYASSLFMTVSTILPSKKQICKYEVKVNNVSHYEILEKICALLEDKNQDIKQNTILALRNLAELPEGFLKIIDILHEKLELMNEVFGVDALRGLTDLLPKLSQYKNPPYVEKDMLLKYSKVIKGIVYFYKKYQDDAAEILIHSVVNINQKLAPFYLINQELLHQYVKYLIERIGKKDPFNQQIFNEFMEKYGGDKSQIKADDSMKASQG
ncbi:MAG: hypothetical protein MJ252_29520 [archaeon]|nr:hypothetical protein [archaeon]